eukprot:gene29563-36632_t
MSQFNFNGRALEMLVQEAKCAAIMIQHAYRARRYSIALKSFTLTVTGFGSEREARMSRLGVVNARSDELRAKWRSLRCFHNDKELALCGGLRGPIHVGPKYTELTLEIILHLLSSKAGQLAQSNREDVVRSQGCILLASYLAFPTGRFSFVSAAILANIAKVSESFEPLLKSGCLYAAVKVLKYLRLIGIGTQNIKERKGARYPMLQAYVDCVSIISSSAIHAAGLYRACHSYGFLKEAHDEMEKVDYQAVLARLSNRSTAALSRDVVLYLGDPRLLKELCTMILQTNHAAVLTQLLQCLFTMLCSHSHNSVTTEITALSGVLIIRLTELLHAKDVTIGTLALSIYLQLCVSGPSRKSLMIVHVPKYLVPLNTITTDYSKKYHQRSILAAAALCRQSEWRYYDPQVLPAYLMGGDGVVRKALYLEILKTMKGVPVELADGLSIADLVVLPTHERRALGMSKAFGTVGAKFVVEFVCHPDQDTYYETLPLDECAATCTILEGMAAHPDTARQVFSGGMVRFIARFTYLCKYLFLGRAMADAQIMVLLNGVLSASVVMSRLCGICEASSTSSEGDAERANVLIVNIRSCELIASILFFLNTLSVLHPKLDHATHELQKKVGITCLSFFNQYAQLLISLEGKSRVSSLEDLYVPGTTVINLITILRSVHGESASIVVMFDHMCQLLGKITLFPAAAFIAVQEWHVVDALRIYLPPPLSGVLAEEELAALAAIDDTDEINQYASGNSVNSTNSGNSSVLALRQQRKEELKVYRMGLDQLPASFFELCANLCQNSDGIAFCLTDGFLRRSLDKLNMLFAQLQRIGSASVHKHIPNWEVVKLELVGCLRLVMKCANFHRAEVGSTNDIILHPFYPIVDICKALLVRRELARSDEIVLVAYEVLAALAKDTYRVSLLLERCDMFSVIKHELLVNTEEFPARGCVAALGILHHSCFGLTSDYIVHMIPHLREPLSKVARIHPSIAVNVREANWTLTKSAMIYRNNVDSAGFVDEHQVLVGEMEQFIRTGETPQSNPIQSRHKSFMVRSSQADMGDLLRMAQSSIATADLNGESSADQPSYARSEADAGTYLYCGVSSHGSLRLALDSTASSDAQSGLDNTLCAVSQLSARDPELRRRLDERKGHYGFQEKKLIDVHKKGSTPTQKRRVQTGSSLPPASPAGGKKMSASPSPSAPKMQSISLQELPELILTRPPGKRFAHRPCRRNQHPSCWSNNSPDQALLATCRSLPQRSTPAHTETQSSDSR